MTRRRPRVLFLPADSRGLGHLSRACKLARGLRGIATCMVATSPDYARRLIPKGCKYVRIPPCPRLLDFRTAEDRRQALAGHGAPAGLAPRRELYLALERTFVPDVIVVDGLPRGWYGELAELLERSQALKVNVLRPVLGAGAMQVAVADLGLEALGRLFHSGLRVIAGLVKRADAEVHVHRSNAQSLGIERVGEGGRAPGRAAVFALECRVATPRVHVISAVTLATHDMGRAVRFYRALGFELVSGGETQSFTSFAVGPGHLNLLAVPSETRWSWWGRIILHVDDVDALYARARSAGFAPEAPPRDAEWGERYFHVMDPDGHELSFARPL